jgi:DNA (cytosine-5)-methyltransferase 1
MNKDFQSLAPKITDSPDRHEIMPRAKTSIIYRSIKPHSATGAIRAIDMFCGAGGSSWGARLAGVEIIAAFDMWERAGEVYRANFPNAKFYQGRIENHSVESMVSQLGNIDLIIASPECTNHSHARGARERCERSRETAFQVLRFAADFRPRWIVVENVQGMRSWTRYPEFKDRLMSLGYRIREEVLNSADFGVPQNRRRLFLLCDLNATPRPLLTKKIQAHTARSIVDHKDTYPYSCLFSPKRAAATLERAERAINVVGRNEPFLIVYYGTDQAGGWQSLDAPLRTLTTLDRFAFVKPSKRGHMMRMLQVPELKAAMGMPKRFRIEAGSRRDRIKLVGNAVCPPVMRCVINHLTSGAGEGPRQ